MSDRYERERSYHDARYSDHDTRAAAGRFYAVTGASRSAYRSALTAAPGSRVLEYGCGEGSAAYDLAAAGAQVVGIDISPVAIDTARHQATELGLADRVTFEVMNAEHLSLADDSFDLVCGTGILHHLELDHALPEVWRVLRSDGRAVFLEPLGHNPVINLYRRRTPGMRTADEHPLLEQDLAEAERWFGSVRVEYFHLLTLAAVPLRGGRGFGRAVELLERADRGLFRRLPRLRKHAWTAVIHLSEKRPTPDGA